MTNLDGNIPVFAMQPELTDSHLLWVREPVPVLLKELMVPINLKYCDGNQSLSEFLEAVEQTIHMCVGACVW